MEHISVAAFRDALAAFLDRAYYRKESFVVTRNGFPFVHLTPVPPDPAPSFQITARDIRKDMSHILGQVHYQSRKALIIRRGQPVAIIISLQDLENQGLADVDRQ
jgi:antitoxin (DNA-binding transcriptional repressor) of toxin-antitoxin stability system